MKPCSNISRQTSSALLETVHCHHMFRLQCAVNRKISPIGWNSRADTGAMGHRAEIRVIFGTSKIIPVSLCLLVTWRTETCTSCPIVPMGGNIQLTVEQRQHACWWQQTRLTTREWHWCLRMYQLSYYNAKKAKKWRSRWSKPGPSADISENAKRTLYHWATSPIEFCYWDDKARI
jgi:hypothetical protein